MLVYNNVYAYGVTCFVLLLKKTKGWIIAFLLLVHTDATVPEKKIIQEINREKKRQVKATRDKRIEGGEFGFPFSCIQEINYMHEKCNLPIHTHIPNRLIPS